MLDAILSQSSARDDQLSRSSKGTVLVVEDELTVARVYERALGAGGYRVLSATDGETAETMFRHCRFDAVVSDVCMPGMDGIEFLKALHRIDSDVPIIMATGDHADARAQQAVDEGALMYLVKPIDLRGLTQVVAHAIKLRKRARRVRAVPELPDPPTSRRGVRAAALAPRFEAALASLWIAHQPIVCWTTLAITGYEVFVRSDEPTLAEPGALFAASRRLGRAAELGRAVRARIAAAIDGAPQGARLFVGVSAAELANDALHAADDPLRPHADRVVLQIPARARERIPDLEDRVKRLRAAGFDIAISDVGAATAGVYSLARLTPSMAKLDTSLVRGVDESPVKRLIVQAVVTLCKDMGVELIAEGVQTEEERWALGFLGCRYQQGSAYATPERGFVTSCKG